MSLFNIYCDESCHLENDKSSVMGFGAIWCAKDQLSDINNRIKDIKQKHGIPGDRELKWTKISPSKLACYEDLINYFFDVSYINFRCVIVLDKDKLNHSRYQQTHDEFYYKMYFLTLKNILNKNNTFNVYFDIKDSKSANKIQVLKDYLENQNYDFNKSMLKNFQSVRSDEIQIMQICDILLGAMVYNNRGHASSKAKLQLINLIKKRTSNSMLRTTLPTETKFNIYHFQPALTPLSEDIF